MKIKFPFLIDTGTENSVIEFAAIVNECDLVITCDTLTLHIATAMEKKIIVLVGPTSAAELYLYEKGIKLTPSLNANVIIKEIALRKFHVLNESLPN